MKSVDKKSYAQAVEQLMELAQGETVGSRVAAQVLLSAYNGGAFQLSVTDLCTLDRKQYQAAIDIICGRYETDAEPQELIENGEACFLALSKQWEKYHVANRAKPSCGTCFGSGHVPEFPDDEHNYHEKPCPDCEGKGF